MHDAVPPLTHQSSARPESNGEITTKSETNSNPETKLNNNGSKNVILRRERPTRACTTRPANYVDPPVMGRKPRPGKRGKFGKMVVKEEVEEEETNEQCSKVLTQLVNLPTTEQLPRWKLRSMWELASILNFFNVFRPLLKITVEFSAEELETALLFPNSTLSSIHIPLLKAVPPVTRMACGQNTWVTVLCRKLRDWWHWVAEGELPIVASHGAEIEAYKAIDPSVRVVILKALCDIRVEQDDIRNYIEGSLKQGYQLSAFRKERVGGDSHGISYWYEDDEIIGHRLYQEIRKVDMKVEVKKGKTKGSHVLPSTSYEWETVATNLDEFEGVSEKLCLSKNRTESSLGKKLRNDMLPEIEKVHKRRERLHKKQQREALLLDNFVTMDGLAAGRSLRDRKPVTYTFDDFDRSINEALEITKLTKHKQPPLEPGVRREAAESEPSADGKPNGSSVDFDEMDEDQSGPLDRSNRRRRRSQRYSEEELVAAFSDNEENLDSDDDIAGEAVYNDEYLRQRKPRKLSSSSEGEEDDEYHWSEENGDDDVEDEEEEEEEEEDSLSVSEDSDRPRRRFKKQDGRTRRGTKLRSSGELETGLRRSDRSTRNRINYRKYEISESETESMEHERGNTSETHSDGTDTAQYSTESRDSEGNDDEEQEMGFDIPTPMAVEKDENERPTQSDSPTQDDPNRVGKKRFLDLNEVAPGSGFEDGPSALAKDDDGKSE